MIESAHRPPSLRSSNRPSRIALLVVGAIASVVTLSASTTTVRAKAASAATQTAKAAPLRKTSITGTPQSPPSSTASVPALATVTPWKLQAAPQAWANGRIYYNQKDEAGVFDGWSANPDGSDARCVTCGPVYPAATQHGIKDVTPDGQYALATIERSGHWPIPDGTYLAAPGNGAYNDLWLQKSDGSKAWRLRNSLVTGASALIWSRFDSTGTRVVWTEQWKWGLPFGGWRMHVADIVWSKGVPSLVNVKTLKSDGLLEAYGFTPDGSRVLFAADVLAGTTWNNLQILTLPANLTGRPVRLSPTDAPDDGNFSNYNEFAFPMPGSDRIIFARSVGAWYMSLEYWTMNADGSDPRQLTWLSQPLSPHYHGYPSLAGGLAFDPENPKQFVAGFGTNYEGDYKSAILTLK
jgi:hypothetical protein